jgi:hypothetical protein
MRNQISSSASDVPIRSAACPFSLSLTLAAVAAARREGAILAQTRGPAASAYARHLAIYLQHVAFGASISACARFFNRDRASVRHACARIEDARDDPHIDVALTALESALRAQSILVSTFTCAMTSKRSGELK